MTSSSNNKNSETNRIRWIENGIAKDYINFYDYNEFQNIKYIGTGASGKVYRASWEGSNIVVALKFLKNSSNFTKEIVNEVRMYYYCYTVNIFVYY